MIVVAFIEVTLTKQKKSEIKMARTTNKKTGELTIKNPFSIVKNGLIIPSPTYAIRNNCQLGQWMKSDGTTPLGNKLDLSILHIERLYGDLGKTKAAHWLQIWAISPQVCGEAVVFVTYVKSIGLTILGNTILDCALDGKNPADLIFKTTFTPRSNEYGSYFSLAFETTERAGDDPKRQEIEQFLSGCPLLMDTNLPSTLFIANDLDAGELEDELNRRRAERKAA